MCFFAQKIQGINQERSLNQIQYVMGSIFWLLYLYIQLSLKAKRKRQNFCRKSLKKYLNSSLEFQAYKQHFFLKIHQCTAN